MKKLIALVLCVVMIAALMCSCSAEKPTTTEAETTAPAVPENIDPYAAYDEPVTIHLAREDVTNTGFPEGDTLEDNEWIRYIKKHANIDIVYDFIVPGGDPWNQKVAAMLASGEMPDAMVVTRNIYEQLIENDMIIDVREIYENYASDFVRGYYDSCEGRNMADATYDGKLMGLPNCGMNDHADFLFVRRDWLKKLNLEMPKTLEDIKNVARAFIEQDPDGNGENDTVGIPLAPYIAGNTNWMHCASGVFSAFDAYPRKWVNGEDGKVVYGTVEPQMKEALAELREMYAEGLIDREFAVRENIDELLVSGKAGLMFGPGWAPDWPLSNSVRNDPNADWYPCLAPIAADGKLHTHTSDPAGMYLVISKECEHPEAIMKIVNLEYDALKLGNPDAMKEISYFDETGNIGSVNWGSIPLALQLGYMDDCYRIMNDLETALETGDPTVVAAAYRSTYDDILKNNENPRADAGAWGRATFRYDCMKLRFGGDVIQEQVAFFGTVPTMETKGPYLQKLENEMLVKIITGDKPLEYFDEFVEEWYKMGGQEITDEVNEKIASK